MALRLNQVRDLLAVIHCGSIRSAAASLGVSQPAVTKSIRLLERELGAELLLRTSGGVTPTAAGRAFAARARVAQHELELARGELRAISGAGAATLKIGISSAPAALFAVDAVTAYRAHRPDDLVQIIEGAGQTLLGLVRDASIDMALTQRVKPEAAPGLKYRPLLRTRLTVACRRNHPLLGAQCLQDLVAAQWLIYRPPGTGGVLEEALAAEGLPFPLQYVQCESFAITAALIASSDLIGLLVPEMLRHPLARSSFEEIRLEKPLPPISVGMYRRTDTPASPATSAFWSALTAAARRVTSGGSSG